MKSQDILLTLFLLVFYLIAGIWLGTIETVHIMQMECHLHQQFKYESFLLNNPVLIKCS